MINTLSNIIRKFITEGHGEKPSINSYLESVVKILEFIRPKSQKEAHYFDVAKQHLKEIRTAIRRLVEENAELHEQVKILEEKNKPKRKK